MATATSVRRLADRESATAIAAHVQSAAARHGVPASLVAAVIAVESQFNPRAISRRGAIGLMQLMPGTAAGLGVRDAFDPRQNVDAGARHLRDLLDRFANDVPLALAAYNAGAQAVIEYGGVPPYPETRAFVARVLGRIERGMLPATMMAATPRRVRVAARLDADGMRESPLTMIPITFIARNDDGESDTMVSVRATPPAVASASALRVEPPRAEAP